MLTNKALWIVERNLRSDLSLTGLAQRCCVSPFHLAHAFVAATGTPVMSYVRGRRLTEAAKAMAGGARDILSVALEFGYGSHEAFTRAFGEQFGETPDAVRKRGALEGLALVEPLDRGRPADVALARPDIAPAAAMNLVGLAARHPAPTTYGIPAQWERFMAMYGLVEDRVADIPVGVNRAFDEAGGFEYVCALEVAPGAGTPKAMVRIALPAQTYAVFQHTQHVSKINDTYSAIWNDWSPGDGRSVADGPSIERHNPTFNPGTGEGGMSIWIPLTA